MILESNLCFFNIKFLQCQVSSTSNFFIQIKFKLSSEAQKNVDEVNTKLSQPLEFNKDDPEANSKSLFFSEEMKASRTSEEKERRSYAGRHLMSICRCS